MVHDIYSCFSARSVQRQIDSCLRKKEKHIKTYQNISKHIKTYQNISKQWDTVRGMQYLIVGHTLISGGLGQVIEEPYEFDG